MLEARVPISPTPAFLNRSRLIAKSLRQWYPDTITRLSCYPTPSWLHVQWALAERIEWGFPWAEEVAEWAGTRAEYSATIFDRFKPPFMGDHILMLDADVFPVARFDELLDFNGIQGVVTHVPPWPSEGWRRLFSGFSLPQPDFHHIHTGCGIMCADGTHAPRGYFNSGMLLGPRKHWEMLAPAMTEAIAYLRRVLSDVYWIDQAALCLAINAAEIPTRDLGIEWNHPNRAKFDSFYGTDNIRFVHAMDMSVVDRDRDFESLESISALCARADLTGSNEVLRQCLISSARNL